MIDAKSKKLVLLSIFSLFLFILPVTAQLRLQESRIDYCDFDTAGDGVCGFWAISGTGYDSTTAMAVDTETNCQNHFDLSYYGENPTYPAYTTGVETENECLRIDTQAAGTSVRSIRKNFTLDHDRTNGSVYLLSFIYLDRYQTNNQAQIDVSLWAWENNDWTNYTRCIYERRYDGVNLGGYAHCWLEENLDMEKLQLRIRSDDIDEGSTSGDMKIDNLELFYISRDTTPDEEEDDSGISGTLDAIIGIFPIIILMNLMKSFGSS